MGGVGREEGGSGSGMGSAGSGRGDGSFRAAGAYHAHDFEWEDLAREAGPVVEAAAAPCLPPGREEAPWTRGKAVNSQVAAWEAFHRIQNNGAKFFEPRRYLMREFPGLLEARKVLELGCGSGSSALPVVQQNKACEVTAIDFSEASVLQLRDAAGRLGLDSSRFRAEVCDVSARPCPPPLQGLGADACLMIFLLSAVEMAQMPDVLSNAWEALCPGGQVYFRDYGLYDSAQLKWPSAQQSSTPASSAGPAVGSTYWRQDGTLSHFFEQSHLEALFEAAGFVTVEVEYACVRVVNRKKRTHMQRVFVHGVFLKASGSLGNTGDSTPGKTLGETI